MYHYGQSEAVSLALKFPKSEELGFMQTYSYSEICNGEGKPVKGGEIGQIIGTSYNFSMPLIRYCTGDYCEKGEYHSDDWMKNCPSIRRVEGRKQDFIVTKDRRLIPLCNIAGSHMKSLARIGEWQYYQEEIGKIILKVTGIADNCPSQEVLSNIKKDFDSFFKGMVDVQVKAVKNIEKSNNNKHIAIEQHLNIEDFR